MFIKTPCMFLIYFFSKLSVTLPLNAIHYFVFVSLATSITPVMTSVRMEMEWMSNAGRICCL